MKECDLGKGHLIQPKSLTLQAYLTELVARPSRSNVGTAQLRQGDLL